MATPSARQAAKDGLASILTVLTEAGGASIMFTSVRSMLAGPRDQEQRPRAAIVARSMPYTHERPVTTLDLDGDGYPGQVAEMWATVSGMLEVMIVAQDDVAGDGTAGVNADTIADAIEYAWGQGVTDTGDPDSGSYGTHGLRVEVATYYGLPFTYYLENIADAHPDLAAKGLADIVATFRVEGPVVNVADAPPMTFAPSLEVDDVDESDLVDTDRIFPGDLPE